ncbi:MAG: hypothetical protein IT428_17190 [Planctomycetaceae bacterium]|nr:hypothetical protein [Planctomycetaceae bacterium]
MEELIREVLANVRPDELHRPNLHGRFSRWYADWKARAEAAVGPAPAATFHFESQHGDGEWSDPYAGGCSPCEQGSK